MRGELHDPFIDPAQVKAAASLASEIYGRHAARVPYGELLERLAELVGTSLTKTDASGAFGSVSPETWARDLLLARQSPPSNLADAELLRLLQAICSVDGEEWQISWWLRCVETCTGCAEIIDLIYYPSDVLGPDDGREELTPEEILAEARRRPRRVLVTPPPKGGAA
jgi:hypothetical protein